MFADEMRRAVEAAPRVRLAELSAAVWKGYAAGALAEDEAQQLAELIQVRKTVTASVHQCKPSTSRQGSRPRSSESMERRRRWTASGWLPPQLACRFTMGEAAALAVVAHQVAQHSQCAMPAEKIAAIAGVSLTTARNAIRQAKALGLITVILRPDRPFRNLPNLIRIASPEWQAWLSLRRSSPVKSVRPPEYHSSQSKEGRAGIKPDSRPDASRWASGERWRGGRR